ncbi:MAG: F0F1 ATP synthase subunit gamma [Candidatus Omnitrophica bacterium]|nr:F0F1 ATP synthase subunit gamma [Candidatus Omnitrophota bacterium]
MKTIAALKQELESTQGLGDIIEVLKTAATIQFRSFQLKEKPNEEFSHAAQRCFSILSGRDLQHPYLLERPGLPSIVLIVTSDEGFLGELNTLLANAGIDQRKSPKDEIVILGERGAKYLEDMNLSFKFFPGFGDEINHEELASIRNYLLETYLKGYGRVVIVYPKFVSLTVQKIEVLPLLPAVVSGLKEKTQKTFLTDELLLEPSLRKVLDVLIELWAAFKLLEVFWSSKQSEYAARIMHLEGSTQELSLLNQRLAFQYFRGVHTLRDRSIREISASKLILEKK